MENATTSYESTHPTKDAFDMAAAIDRFGPFVLDRDRRRLTAHGRALTLSDRHFDVLLALTRQPGVITTKDRLIEEAWRGVAVADDSLYRAISDLRDKLGPAPDGGDYIETLNRKGFRFVAPVNRVPASAEPLPTVDAPTVRVTDDPREMVDRLLAPHLAFVDGRMALETLNAAEITRARDAFTRALDLQPDLTAAHVGLASAWLLQYETTRADTTPDLAALDHAEHHALRACTLAPQFADAWGTYALVLHRKKRHATSADVGVDLRDVAAARRAVSLEPMEWRHHLRLAFVAGGGERLRAAQRVLELRPGFALAHWLVATVLVARAAFTTALDHLRAGCDAQDRQAGVNAGFPAVGMHQLRGLVLAAQGQLDAAHADLAREIDTAPAGHIYTRESCANSWYARGALHLRAGDPKSARSCLESALERMPSHPLAAIALAALAAPTRSATKGKSVLKRLPDLAAGPPETTLVRSAILSLQGQHAESARACEVALEARRDGPGPLWLLPVEPLIDATGHRADWARALDLLAQRSA